jgi:hypothetical protein
VLRLGLEARVQVLIAEPGAAAALFIASGAAGPFGASAASGFDFALLACLAPDGDGLGGDHELLSRLDLRFGSVDVVCNGDVPLPDAVPVRAIPPERLARLRRRASRTSPAGFLGRRRLAGAAPGEAPCRSAGRGCEASGGLSFDGMISFWPTCRIDD